MEKKEINLIPFIAEAFSTNKKIYKDIDNLYNTDKIKFIEVAKENEFYNHLMSQAGNIEQEYYFKKSLGLILTSDDSILEQNIFKMIKKGWKYTYTYVESHNLLSVSDFLNSFIKKNKGINNVTVGDLNSNVLILDVLSEFFQKEVDINDDMYINNMTSFIRRIEYYKKDNRINIDEISKEKKKQIRELELKIKKEDTINFMPSGYRLSADKYNDLMVFIDKLTKNDKLFSAFEYILDLENISLITIVGENYLKSKEIQELILCYTQLRKDDEDIDFEELKKYLYPAIQIRYLCKEYKKAKKYFFQNFDEELFDEISKKENENNEIKKDNLLFQGENEKLKAQIDEFKRENKRLNLQLVEKDSEKTELVALRELMFSLDCKGTFEIDDTIDYDKLNNTQGVLVGGHSSLHLKLKEILKEWIFISLENMNFDERLLLNSDKIYIYTDHLNHGMYYKVMNTVNKNNLKVQYIEGNTNVDLILKQFQKNYRKIS